MSDIFAKATAEIVIAYISTATRTSPEELVAIISKVGTALSNGMAGGQGVPDVAEDRPWERHADDPVLPDRVVCLECGRRLSILKRHLMTSHGLTPHQYKEKHGLPHDATLIAPAYSTRRSDIAKASGLGHPIPM
jgi:predicted transcriptional regulator